MVYNLRTRAGMAKSGEALKGSQEKENRHDAARPKVVVEKPTKSCPKAKIDRPKAKAFSSLQPHLQELVLLKTSTETRLRLFQVSRQLREWVFKEGLFPRDVQRIETAYRPQRPGEEIVTYDCLRIFKILTRSGLADPVEIDVADAKRSMALKNIRSCRDLIVFQDREHGFRIVDFFPNLKFLETFNMIEFDEVLFEGTSLEVTLALNVPNEFYLEREFDEEELFEWIDKYASRCPSINFADIPFERTVEFLRTRKLRFMEYFMDSEGDDRKIVEMFLKYGIPGEHPDPCIKMGVGPGLLIHVMRDIMKDDTLVIGDLKRIQKKFMDHRAEVGWRFDNSVLGPNAVGFTSRFDESKNVIFLFFENNFGDAELLIKYEMIEK